VKASRRLVFSGIIGGTTLLSALFLSCGQPLPEGLYAKITTSKGTILLALEYEKTPLTVCNFVGLAEGRLGPTKGKPFYAGLTFHRVVADFMIQGGDPQGNGSGGPGYVFPDEIVPDLKFSGPGVLAMANAGSNTNGSQFFITHVATPWLDGKHSIFGHVVQGQEIVNMVKEGDTIKKISIVRSGAKARAFKSDQAAFDSLLAAAKERVTAKASEDRANNLALIAQKWPHAGKSLTGIFYVVEKKGSGPKPASGKKVRMNYVGSFLDGSVFDASANHGGPMEFQVGVGQVITGWDEMAMDMKKGEIRTVVIPPELAYGERGAGSVIPANAFLVFQMDLVEIVN
jgi:peptidyl-prolyl cis-trans isomerase A (cyclophilin A)